MAAKSGRAVDVGMGFWVGSSGMGNGGRISYKLNLVVSLKGLIVSIVIVQSLLLTWE